MCILANAASVAQAQPAHFHSLIMGYAVLLKNTQGFVESPECTPQYVDPDKTVRMRRLCWSYNDNILHKTDLRLYKSDGVL
ncbi:hypothetical protein DPMN_160778 [Dreissena polymorpha]|uniref:Uncharacterized protein n=1 Tax=Dreissena polymorpha TaxID=45954 RepID=A0A9D4ENH7_DREPO|nr:hypothetical protein DPMN_160778 [Dreissena polymorpha]